MLSPNLELILAYFENLEDQNFFGTVEITLQAGKLAYSRELRSKQDFEIAAESWGFLSEERKKKLLEKLGSNSKFLDLIKKRSKSTKKPA